MCIISLHVFLVSGAFCYRGTTLGIAAMTLAIPAFLFMFFTSLWMENVFIDTVMPKQKGHTMWR